jgi:hypothetical protein
VAVIVVALSYGNPRQKKAMAEATR